MLTRVAYIVKQLKVRKKGKRFYNDAYEHEMALKAPGTFQAQMSHGIMLPISIIKKVHSQVCYLPLLPLHIVVTKGQHFC